MKELTKIKLVNWHYFTNEEIEIKGSTLITGDNGSGKSTILDAIQYILVADLRNVKFNVSAHDETKRSLIGYLRCKTGVDTEGGGQKFLRSGDITSYVALEFYDNVADEYFTVGAVIDSYRDNITYKTNFFKLERTNISDDLFFHGNTPRNIKEFRQFIKTRQGATVYPTNEQYREDILVKMGSLSERFFSLFVKAISFKPIIDIRDFVYSYVLDERNVNIDTMRENFERYNHFLNLVKQTKEKLLSLEEIKGKYGELQREMERAITHDYLIKRAKLEYTKELLEGTLKSQSDMEANLQIAEEELVIFQGKGDQLDEEYMSYREALASDTTYQMIRDLQNVINQLNQEKNSLERESRDFAMLVTEELKSIDEFLSLTKEENYLTLKDRACLLDLSEFLRASIKEGTGQEDLPVLHHLLNSVKEIFTQVSNDFNQRIWQVKNDIKKIEEKESELKRDLAKLKNNELVYDEKVISLRDLISDKMKEEGINLRPAILCELLEIRNEEWQNAVEGFLNTQRFDLIVEPEYFDRALSIYERYKRDRGIYGVGLVNTGKVMGYKNRRDKNSLAEEVISKNPYATAYINQLMGTLIKCQSEQELKRYPRSITKTCMTYINNTARQINFKVYETPYIGAKALIQQIAKKEEELAELSKEKIKLISELKEITSINRCTLGKEERYYRIRERFTAPEELKEVTETLREKMEELKAVDTSGIDLIRSQMESLKKNIDENKDKISQLNKAQGQLEAQINSCKTQIYKIKIDLNNVQEDYNNFISYHMDKADELDNRYNKEYNEKGKDKERTPTEVIMEVFTTSRKSIDTLIAKKREELTVLRMNYNTEYQFGGGIDGPDITDFEEEYVKLIESKLPEYEGKIEIAKGEAEEEFKEHFVYKLKENIETARNEFRILNDALKDIEFGEDRYQFIIEPNPAHRKFYDMIMDSHLFEGSLFDVVFQEKHQEAMDELFNKIVSQRQEYIQTTLQEYTDYRTFLDYDIKITNRAGETSTFSKVCREKSGGETQTPYYVAIVASFMQLYRVKTNQRSMRLIIFDEAFNRMDSDRIEKSLKFMSNLGLQFIIAAPTDRCEYITPYITTTQLVFRDGIHSWIEDYKRLVS